MSLRIQPPVGPIENLNTKKTTHFYYPSTMKPHAHPAQIEITSIPDRKEYATYSYPIESHVCCLWIKGKTPTPENLSNHQRIDLNPVKPPTQRQHTHREFPQKPTGSTIHTHNTILTIYCEYIYTYIYISSKTKNFRNLN